MKFKNLFLFMDAEESANRAFTPADIFNPALWLRPEDLPASGEISTWIDASGNGRNATQATSINRPVVLANALNGFRAASFDGVNDRLSGTAIPHTGEYSYFIVSRLKNTPSDVAVFFHNGTASNGYFQAMFASRQRYLGHGGVNDMVVTGNFVPVNTWEISNSQRQSGTVDFRLNGNNLAITNSTINFNNPTGSYWLGAYTGGVQFPTNIDIIEVIVHTTSLTTDQRTSVYNYLKSKYNL